MAREPAPLNWKSFVLLLTLALGLGSLYRLTDLAKKPMHTDEAILALKTHEYAQTGAFKYDPKDYHGPFLHHAAKVLAQWRSWDPTQLDEGQVRWVVAIFGLGLLLIPLLMIDALGRTGAVAAALLMGVSPMMVYYSRYYIMEVPFVFLVGLFIASVWRWYQGRNVLWLLVGGVCLGWMHATKETFVLNIAAMMGAWAIVSMRIGSFEKRNGKLSYAGTRHLVPNWLAWAVLCAIAVLTSVWSFSNGFQDWQGVQDSIATYESYLRRSGGSGHEKPWYYYILLLTWYKDGFVWSEGLIVGLALVGMLDATLDNRRPPHVRAFLVFLSLYSLFLLGIYSLIPYKTPWSIMAVQYAFILLAGLGIRMLFRSLEMPFFKTILLIAFGTGIYHLCSQTNLATDYSFPGKTRYAADSRNPYVYSHTTTNLLELAKRVHELAAAHPAGLAMPMQVIQREQGWPLPWYLRDMPNVGYQAELPTTLNTSVVITDLDRDQDVRGLLAGEYLSSPYGLRPGMMLSLLVEKNLWERYTAPSGTGLTGTSGPESRSSSASSSSTSRFSQPQSQSTEAGQTESSLPVLPPTTTLAPEELTPPKAEAVSDSLALPASTGTIGTLPSPDPGTGTLAVPTAPALGDSPVRKAEPVLDDAPVPPPAPEPAKPTRRNRSNRQ
jgi:uncharacterized protein (TIGR03663 family)